MRMLTMRLVNVVELDASNFQITVLERWSERRWFRTVHHEREHTYTLQVGAGWIDGDRFVTDTALSPRLYELLLVWKAEQRLNEYVGLCPPPCAPYRTLGPLPPVPIMPGR